jgi:peptidase E
MNVRKPVYLMAGGDFRRPSGMISRIKTILAETGKDHPGVAYIGTASKDDASFFKFAADMIKEAGARSVSQVLLSGRKADASGARSLLEAADAVFVSGGDVEAGMRPLQRYNLISFLRSLRDSGTLFFGISAGSIMLGTHWVGWEDPDDDSGAALFDCIGIAPVVCDTHAEEDGWEELTAAVNLLEEGGRGYGIPTGGTLRVDPDGAMAALDKPVVCYLKKPGGAVGIDDLMPSQDGHPTS